jgi:hypothetical protein
MRRLEVDGGVLFCGSQQPYVNILRGKALLRIIGRCGHGKAPFQRFWVTISILYYAALTSAISPESTPTVKWSTVDIYGFRSR